MKYLIISITLAVFLVGCDNKPKQSFSINKNDTNSTYANNKHFKQVDHSAYTYYFKGAPNTYYGISLKGKDVFSGYVVFMGSSPSLCFSKLNFRGRKTFNSLLKDLKEKNLLEKETTPSERVGNITYKSYFSSSQFNAVDINYNTDTGFGYLTIQSSGCMKALL